MILRRMPNQSPSLDLMFQALADPTRRVIVERLAQGPASVSELAQPFAMSLPAVFQHLQMLEASGFLAAYAAGVIVGNGAGARAPAVERAFEAFGWVAQIGLFLVLGLLVTPHDLVPLAMPALSVAAALIFVARPLSALICLRPLGFGWGETGFVGWVGLRGAVPIYLALIPVLQGVPGSELIFTAAFLIVLVSLAVQGWTIGPVARLMRLGA